VLVHRRRPTARRNFRSKTDPPSGVPIATSSARFSTRRFTLCVTKRIHIFKADDLAPMRRIDELHLELPFYGSRRMTFQLNEEGRGVNRKRVQRLMRVMGMPLPGRAGGAAKGG
jgi:hypothetical protein